MSGPHISIVPADTEKTISLNPNVGISDIKVSSQGKGSYRKSKPKPKQKPVFHELSDDDDDNDEHIHFGKQNSRKNTEFPNANEYAESELSDVSSEHDQQKGGDQFLSNLSNPSKVRHSDDVDDDESQQPYQNNTNNNQQGYGSFNNVESERDESEQIDYESQKRMHDEEKKRLSEEKQEMLYKFHRLESKGIRSTRRFTMESSLEDMKIEFNKLTRQIEVEQSIKFQRRALMAMVSGMEFLNKRYDPFDVKLDGWSESVMEGVEEYDTVFERLYEKYKSKSEMAPEVELMLSLFGSAFMFHLTKTLFKSAMPNMADIAKQNPELMQNVAQAMMQNMSTQRKGPSEPMQNGAPPDNTGPPAPVNPRREMRGPSIQAPPMGMGGAGAMGGLGDMMQQLGPLGNMMQDMLGNLNQGQSMPQMNTYQNGPPLPQMAREPANQVDEIGSEDGFSGITSVSSIDFGNPTKTKDILINNEVTKKRGRKGGNRSKAEVTLNI